MIRPNLACFSLFLLAACAPATHRWENPGVPEDRWAQDRTYCRHEAVRQTEGEYERDHNYASDPNLGRSNTYEGQMARYDSGKRRDVLYTECLRARGYRKVMVEEPK